MTSQIKNIISTIGTRIYNSSKHYYYEPFINEGPNPLIEETQTKFKPLVKEASLFYLNRMKVLLKATYAPFVILVSPFFSSWSKKQ